MGKKKITISYILSQVILILLAAVVIYPLFFVIMTSVKSNFDVLTHPFTIHSFKLENYNEAWRIGKIGKYFMNSVFITAVTLMIQMVVIVLAAYAFGKLKPWGHNVLLIVYMTGLFVTSEMITVPNFMTMKELNLTGTRLSLILPYVTNGTALATYIMTNFIKELPKELDEAATMDGCGILQNLYLITLPLMKPVLATITIFNFQGVWSEFYWALIMIKKESIKTLSLGLMNFQSQYNTDYGVLCAGLTISIIPVLLLYLKCSSQFIGGITAGAVKG
ncbi:carbohydrate ABC transporter permease [Clostridium sp. AN503]|uniref:carbohydrate ABC transporter permease n=1 Tax=Clostridium sp. AN503 TaxID=3160598 RepID=UPI00345AAD33